MEQLRSGPASVKALGDFGWVLNFRGDSNGAARDNQKTEHSQKVCETSYLEEVH
jgi:hypothetical protein